MIKQKIRALKKYLLYRYSNNFPYRRFLSKNKCIFIHIPKAAGTSILAALSDTDKKLPRDHASAVDFLKANPERFHKSYKFTFTRHPVSRLFSTYNYLLNGGNGSTDRELSKKISEYKDFNDFVLNYIHEDILHYSVLFKPQFSFICNEQGKVIVDFLGKYENIENDFLVIKNKLELKSSLRHKNSSKTSTRCALSENAVTKIYNLYQLDFVLFGYSKKIPTAPHTTTSAPKKPQNRTNKGNKLHAKNA